MAMTVQGMESMGDWMALKLARGSESAANAIQLGGKAVKDRMTPSERTYVASPQMETRLQSVRSFTEKATIASAALASGVQSAGAAVVRKVSVPLANLAAKHLSDGTTGGTVQVLGSGAKGIVVVYAGLEAAARRLASELSATFADVISHVYGEDAGRATGMALDSAGNISSAYMNISRVSVRGALTHGTAHAVAESAQVVGSSRNAVNHSTGNGTGGGSADAPGCAESVLGVADESDRRPGEGQSACDGEGNLGTAASSAAAVQTQIPGALREGGVTAVTPAPSAPPMYDWTVFRDKQ
eukprot:Opistho-2@96128